MESSRSPSVGAVTSPAWRWSFDAPSGWSRTEDPHSGVWGERFDEQAVAHGPRGSGFYMRGNLVIPVVDGSPDVVLVVWVSMSGDDFQRAHLLWDDAARVDEPASLVRLDNRLPGYPDTWGLDAHLCTQPVGRRPLVELDPADHPLVAEQKRGVTHERAREIVHAFEQQLAVGASR